MRRRAGSLMQTKAMSVEVDSAPVQIDMNPEGDIPPLIRATGSDGSLPAWITENREQIQRLRLERGGVLFRGFGLSTADDFNQVVSLLGGDQLDYKERSSPRSRVNGKIFTSTDHPADQPINFHNELAYSGTWPMEIFFFAQIAPAEGGETPIADSRRVLSNISEPLRERFRRNGVMYMRYLGSGLGLHWKEVFQLDNPADVEEYCRERGIEFRWEGESLRTWVRRPAIRVHPDTGEEVWFNHGHFFNLHSMKPDVREQMLEVVDRENLPFDTKFGDGSEITADIVAEIDQAFSDARVEFAWEQGDLLYLDNMLTAHARNPFEGERKILVAMCTPYSG